MDKNETYRKQVYRKNCMDFSQHHGIKEIKKKHLRRCKCTRVNEATTIASQGCKKEIAPLLHYDFSYKETADKIGTFSVVYIEKKPVAVLFAYCTGETFVTYDMNILFFLKNAGYRNNYAFAM